MADDNIHHSWGPYPKEETCMKPLFSFPSTVKELFIVGLGVGPLIT